MRERTGLKVKSGLKGGGGSFISTKNHNRRLAGTSTP